MNSIKISLHSDPAWFRPGDSIPLQVGWALEEAPESVAVRLFWYTEGKGDQDVGIENEQRFETPPAEFLTEAQFTAPHHPYSYDGRVVSILWAVEAVVEPSGETSRAEFVISPTGAPLTPEASDD